jgi:hypothetical protein
MILGAALLALQGGGTAERAWLHVPGRELHSLGLAETKYAEENSPVRVQPIRRRRADLAGNDRAVERGQLVEAHQRGSFQASRAGHGDGSHVGAAALN